MSYKSILTYADGEDGPDDRIATAVELARRFEAHLTIAALGYEPDIPPFGLAAASGAALAELYDRARERSESVARSVGELLEREAVNGEARALVSTTAGLARKFAGLARFSDLVVLGQPSVAAFEQAAANLLEGALFEGDVGALVCPASVPKVPGETVLIGWNGDREALRAVRRAMPFLRRARTVEIAVVDPPGEEGNPGADLAVLLARHGIGVEVTTHARAGQGVGALLRQRALDMGADLMVVGAWGHSRFREYVLGGVTRDLLENARVPVLMAH